MIVFLSIVSFILFAAFVASCFVIARLYSMLFKIEDNCQSALNEIDLRYTNLKKLMKDYGILSNDVVARQIVKEIHLATNAILYVANVLKSPTQNVLDNENEIDILDDDEDETAER